MTTLYCAICAGRFEADADYVRIDAEHVRTHDRNEVEEYVFHPDCWDRLSKGWMDPV